MSDDQLSFNQLFVSSSSLITDRKKFLCIYAGHSIKKSKIFFSINENSALFVIGLSQKYLFSVYLKWSQAKKSTPGLNRGLSSNFWWLRSANHVKFMGGWVMYMEKHVLVKKNVCKCAKHGFALMGIGRKNSP